jgi:hypothetical protein
MYARLGSRAGRQLLASQPLLNFQSTTGPSRLSLEPQGHSALKSSEVFEVDAKHQAMTPVGRLRLRHTWGLSGPQGGALPGELQDLGSPEQTRRVISPVHLLCSLVADATGGRISTQRPARRPRRRKGRISAGQA